MISRTKLRKSLFIVVLLIPFLFLGLIEGILQITGYPEGQKVLSEIDHPHAPANDIVTPILNQKKNTQNR